MLDLTTLTKSGNTLDLRFAKRKYRQYNALVLCKNEEVVFEFPCKVVHYYFPKNNHFGKNKYSIHEKSSCDIEM